MNLHDPKTLLALCKEKKLLGKEALARAADALTNAPRTRTRQKNRGAPPALSPVQLIASLHFDLADGSGKKLTEETIMQAAADDAGIPYVKLDPLQLDLNIVTGSIPKSYALKHLLLPFAIEDGTLSVATCSLDKATVLEDIEKAVQIKVKPFLSSETDIRRILHEFFGFHSSISAAESSMGAAGVDLGNLEQYVRISATQEMVSTDQHIKGAVDHLFNYAFDQNASDIHLEPKRDTLLVRLRIDGILHTVYTLPKTVHPPILSRIKTLARLDIAEKRRPQDGRIKIARDGGLEAEIRVSTVPVAFGEKAVLRILDPMIIFQELDSLGFTPADLKKYHSFLRAPYGIILVTGPTGSGKSTTLYSTLKKLATPQKNIITVEDPVEMVHEEFNQISVQHHVDVTFGTILRNILRQDPDIIMIGEIRDQETARHAVQAALTGHLVFSTLHTNDAVASITRLEDLGIQPFLIASTLVGVMAQRLTRRICPHCAQSYKVPATDLRAVGFQPEGDGPVTLRRGKGCEKCRQTGYLGRSAIYEVLTMTSRLRKMVVEGQSGPDILQAARSEGMITLKENGWEQVRAGITTFREVARVLGDTVE